MANIRGTNKNDILFGTNGNDVIEALDGDDLILSSDGKDTILGGSGIDTVDYGTYRGNLAVQLVDVGMSSVYGNGQIGDLLGGIENISGGRGNDLFGGNIANNRFSGRAGHDTFIASGGFDVYIGGRGYDTVDYSSIGTGIETVLTTNGATVKTGGILFDTIRSIENIIGTNQDDIILGGAENNEFSGGAGNDILNGGAGGDELFGGAGDDTLTGGAHADIFIFAPGGGDDIVTDFTATGAYRDRLDLSAYDLNMTIDDLLANYVVQTGDDVTIFSTGGDSVLLENVDKADLTAANFIL